MAFGIFSDDPADYVNPDRPDWHKRRGAPLTLSATFGGIGLLIGLIIGWTTDLREAPAGIVGGVGGMRLFDFYWRWVKDTLPLKRR